MATTERQRWTNHVCPKCGSWIRLWGAVKYGMGKCSNKKCDFTEARVVDMFPTKLEFMRDNPLRSGCPVCDGELEILPTANGGPDKNCFIGHFLVHTKCRDEMIKLLDYQGKLFQKEMEK